jgi:hypothetical protein
MPPAISVAEPLVNTTALVEQQLQRRAVEAVNWGLPAVNYDRMHHALLGVKGAANQVVLWSGLADWKNQTLTPSPDIIYVMPFVSTRDVGPVVLEIPPADEGSITGTVMDAWQGAIEDVGPAGVDQGKGARYLILPPDFDGSLPDDCIPLRCATYRSFALLRSHLKSGSETDIARAVAYARRIRLYPLGAPPGLPTTTFVDVIDRVFDGTIPYDMRFFQSLDRFVQIEPWLARDRVMIDRLRSIGIEKGKLFRPDARTQNILRAALVEAHAWLKARFEAAFPPYYDGRQWALVPPPETRDLPATLDEAPDRAYRVDDRGLLYSYAFSAVKHRGAGTFYLFALRDAQGRPLDGGNRYRLVVPADVPVRHYWSVVVYDRDTHGLLRNVQRPGRSSQSGGLQKNSDGSVPLYFGPKPPPGREPNWIPTNPGGRWEAAFRFYGPEPAVFDRTWTLPDIEETS